MLALVENIRHLRFREDCVVTESKGAKEFSRLKETKAAVRTAQGN